MTGTDAWVERASRWLANRSTRRSFLGRSGQIAVMVASGSAVAGLLADRAEGRVCGQSGVSPKCADFDCADIWGWCWYARGCCAGGGLKKICDCCAVNWPNVHGYCPSGTNVKCIVESCLNDPRVQVVDLVPARTDDLQLIGEAVRPLRWGSGHHTVVLTDASPLWAAVAAPVAGLLEAPAFLVGHGGLPPAIRSEIRRLGARRAKVVGGHLPSSVDDALRADGVEVERIGSSLDVGRHSVEVAGWVRAFGGARQTVMITATGVSAAAAGIAAAYAAAHGEPLVVGPDAAEAAGARTVLVGPEAVAFDGRLAASVGVAGRTGSTSLPGLSTELYDWGTANGGFGTDLFSVVPEGSPAPLALAALRAPVLIHRPGTLEPLSHWLLGREERHGRASRVIVAGGAGQLRGDPYALLQSILNGYDVHRLIGVAGQGLPVISQPVSERPLGRARVASAPSEGSTPQSYYASRAR